MDEWEQTMSAARSLYYRDYAEEFGPEYQPTPWEDLTPTEQAPWLRKVTK